MSTAGERWVAVAGFTSSLSQVVDAAKKEQRTLEKGAGEGWNQYFRRRHGAVPRFPFPPQSRLVHTDLIDRLAS